MDKSCPSLKDLLFFDSLSFRGNDQDDAASFNERVDGFESNR